MQKLLIMLIIVLNPNQSVKCDSIFGFIHKKFDRATNYLLNVYTTVETRIRKVLHLPKLQVSSGIKRRNMSSFFLSKPLTVLQNGTPNMNLVISRSAHTLTTPQIAATHGRIVETHVTYTSDGYMLTLHRLHSYKEPKDNTHVKRTVLLHHGLLGSSADWILLGPKKSLPYILADAGHDVWLANARGNYYSRAHVSMSIDSDEFWNFTWQDMGERDLPATLDYIRKTNNSTEPIDYIGHSMGATALLVLLSTDHNYYNSQFRIAFLLAPLAFMANTRGPLQNLALMDKTMLKMFLGTREFMPTRRTSVSLTSKMCSDFEVYCKNPLFFLAGSPLQEGTRTVEFRDQLQEYAPAGGSAKTIMHYVELIRSQKFHRFNQPNWQFKLKYISTPTLILSSTDDSISNATDNQMLYFSILNPVGHIIIKDQSLSHTEFAWGSNADILFYYKIRDLIDLGPEVLKV